MKCPICGRKAFKKYDGYCKDCLDYMLDFSKELDEFPAIFVIKARQDGNLNLAEECV